MLRLLLLTAGAWTAISVLFTWRLAAAFPLLRFGSVPQELPADLGRMLS